MNTSHQILDDGTIEVIVTADGYRQTGFVSHFNEITGMENILIRRIYAQAMAAFAS